MYGVHTHYTQTLVTQTLVVTNFSPKVEERPHMNIPISAIQKLGVSATRRSPGQRKKSHSVDTQHTHGSGTPSPGQLLTVCLFVCMFVCLSCVNIVVVQLS